MALIIDAPEVMHRWVVITQSLLTPCQVDKWSKEHVLDALLPAKGGIQLKEASQKMEASKLIGI